MGLPTLQLTINLDFSFTANSTPQQLSTTATRQESASPEPLQDDSDRNTLVRIESAMGSAQRLLRQDTVSWIGHSPVNDFDARPTADDVVVILNGAEKVDQQW
jgi:hypothetical protein